MNFTFEMKTNHLIHKLYRIKNQAKNKLTRQYHLIICLEEMGSRSSVMSADSTRLVAGLEV